MPHFSFNFLSLFGRFCHRRWWWWCCCCVFFSHDSESSGDIFKCNKIALRSSRPSLSECCREMWGGRRSRGGWKTIQKMQLRSAIISPPLPLALHEVTGCILCHYHSHSICTHTGTWKNGLIFSAGMLVVYTKFNDAGGELKAGLKLICIYMYNVQRRRLGTNSVLVASETKMVAEKSTDVAFRNKWKRIEYRLQMQSTLLVF